MRGKKRLFKIVPKNNKITSHINFKALMKVTVQIVAAFAAIVAVFISYVSAECPNACRLFIRIFVIGERYQYVLNFSAHGKCGAYDACTCYRNWISNDCSESNLFFPS